MFCNISFIQPFYNKTYYESQIWDKTIFINLSIGKQDFVKQIFQIYHHLLNMHHGSRNRIKILI